ncbi:alanine racemase [Blastochloris tepida]|uniref:Alanine racemase n=1 Tax=Blastochloris tepida TaxID=2233851 RepID=A0A348G2Q9_9HYPH|nr:alanine racemase [Blastochloris tepida]BBF93842.1 alanine racemase [Blastochloris tepida]
MPAVQPLPAGTPDLAGGVLTIDLAALVANWRALAARLAPAACAGVVKADAYGCGAAEAGRALRAAGCTTFFVALPAEGRALRAAVPDAAIYVLNGLPQGAAETFATARLRPVIGDLGELAEWEAFVARTGWSEGAALHLDTGMNRLGLRPEEARALALRPRGQPPVSLVMSHFACADEKDHPMTARQIALFREVRALFPGVPASLANSAGVFLGPEAHFDLARPGYALYGGNPTPWTANPMRPVVRLDLRIIQARTVPPGETVGYGARWTAPATRRIAVVSAGYADGLLRAASARPGARVLGYAGGVACPLVGRISMDLAAFDVTDAPADAVQRGDTIALLSERFGVDDYAEAAGTIGYEVLTSLGRRYRRVHVGG